MLKHSGLPWRWAFALCALAILVLALMSAPPKVITTGWDKSNHALGFAVLMVLGSLAFSVKRVVLLVGLLAFGALIEVLQSFTCCRAADWGDLAADLVGLVVGWGVGRWVALDPRVKPEDDGRG